MTIINNIEIDNIVYQKNIIKDAINNNDNIEDKLNVIIVISNPVLYAIRYILAKEFIKRIEEDEVDVNLYVVELAYGNQKFIITNKKNKNHLQIRTKTPLWHKENMINLGVKKLLPKNWKAFAWIDSDIEFDSPTWASDTLKVLNGCKDIVQLFSHADDLNENNGTNRIFNSFAYQYTKGNPYCASGPGIWHPGFAWAMTRKAYDKIGGLYQNAILGAGDHIMAFSIIRKADNCLNIDYSDGYKNSIYAFQDKICKLRLGYIPGLIRHYYHGAKINRGYATRWKILIKHNFDPYIHITLNKDGIIVPTLNFPQDLLDDIIKYFKDRNEDEALIKKIEMEKILLDNKVNSLYKNKEEYLDEDE